jgi:hypothetical protein
MQKYRISTNLGKDQKVNVELKQDFDVLEILSLKFTQEQVYASSCADYGVICGRVTANNGLGLSNAKVSIFVPLDDADASDPVISALYPYKEYNDRNADGYRYNLLPARQQHGGHTPTGTFFDQTDILEREEVLEVYEKYYNYTVKTNDAGDFMIWGVPTGNHQLHVDVDLSDIGCFSLRPQDLIRLGKGTDNFKNKYTFKASNDLDALPQIVSFDRNIEVYPFWGNASLCEIAITRADFDTSALGVRIQPKAYLIGGVFSDAHKFSVNKNGTPRVKMGRKCDMVPRSAKIEALRYQPERDENHRPYIEYMDLHEDVGDDGSFVFPLDMNMDYVFTNEFGENEITNDPNKGVATSACYRLRYSVNNNGLDRVRAIGDFLLPNIREYGYYDQSNNWQIDDKSYAFTTEWSGYPQDAISLMTNTIDGEYYPQDYFFRFTYNKVYTVSSFHHNYSGANWFGQVGYANINQAHPSEEEDCGDKLTPPTNYGVESYSFTLLIADFLLILDYVFRMVTMVVVNTLAKLLDTIAELIITVTSGGRDLRGVKNNFIARNCTTLNLINFPECSECSDADGNCGYYETPYDDKLITGWFVEDPTSNCNVANNDLSCMPGNVGRRFVSTLAEVKIAQAQGHQLLGTAIYGSYIGPKPANYYPYGGAPDIVDGNVTGQKRVCINTSALFGLISYDVCYDNGDGVDLKFAPSARSEFRKGIFYFVPGTMSNTKVVAMVNEYYRRKRVGKMFCGGIVNYGFMDNWLSGSLYLPQIKIKNVKNAIDTLNEKVAKYSRAFTRLVVGQKALYYRSAPFDGTNFIDIIRPTTFVDMGPRDEFIKEICTDPNLDPNCSVSRSIGATSYQDLGELLGLAINYRMETAGTSGKLAIFFQNTGFRRGNVLDGDILQLLSQNNEAGIEGFDIENPRYIGYRYDVLDPKLYPEFFKKNGDWGPLPVTLELNEDGYRIRTCLNEGHHLDYYGNYVKGRLVESAQKVPFYYWNKNGDGFGGTGQLRNLQSWDYGTIVTQPLQGMTYAYNLTGLPNSDKDPYALLPITNTYSGLTLSNLNLTDQVEFETISNVDKTSLSDIEYPGYTYLYVTGGTINGVRGLISPNDVSPSGKLYIRYGTAGQWQTILWNTNVDVVLPQRYDYYSGYKHILSTPYQFYFGLMAGKTGLDKFMDLFGPKGAFPPVN